jgi:hypothetical protein
LIAVSIDEPIKRHALAHQHEQQAQGLRKANQDKTDT